MESSENEYNLFTIFSLIMARGGGPLQLVIPKNSLHLIWEI